MVIAAVSARTRGAASLREVVDDLRSGKCENSSIRALGRRWKWSKNRTGRYLKAFCAYGWARRTATGYLWDGIGKDEMDHYWFEDHLTRDDWLNGEASRYIPKAVREQVWREGGGVCAFCGSSEFVQIDHIRPFSRHGRHRRSNLRLLCRSCNLRKGFKTDEEWMRCDAALLT